ncbi:hypothetical protein AB5J56_00275 [Streptomyces sp. R21]|uniref:Secreted protein/lipoprotein n=1 Tax=Streptomyces sp. R21 TaxID=3238627 RepID=A0AB39P239_9ACTN
MKRRAHQTLHSAVRFRNRTATALGLCAVLAVSACSSSNDNDGAAAATSRSAASTPAPSTSSADPQAVAKQQVLDAYQHYWDEKTAAYAKASMAGTDLKTYAKGNALGLAQSDLKNMETAGQATKGHPRITPHVSSLDLAKKVPLAKITDCVDVSTWKLINTKTNSEVELPKQRRTKYVSHVTAELWGKQWVILDVKPEDRAC